MRWRHHIASTIEGRHLGPKMPFTMEMGSTNLPYLIDQSILEWSGIETPIPNQIWRSVGYSYNTFVVESFISELAEKAGYDPLTYRLKLLTGDQRLTTCIKTVAEMSNWSDNKRPLGLSSYYFGTTAVAMAVEVSGASNCDFQVENVWCVLDCGIAVNPDSVAAQVESGIIDGLSAAIYGEITIKNNAVEQSNFHDYRLLRMAEAPEIETRIIKSTAYPSGVGEASLPGIAPALTEALYQLSGQRVRHLPIRA